MLIAKKTLAVVWFSALLLAVTSIIATTTITTPIASAADEQPAPSCTNPKGSTLPAGFPPTTSPAYTTVDRTGCIGAIQTNATYGTYTYTLTAAQRDDGRYTSAKGGSEFVFGKTLTEDTVV